MKKTEILAHSALKNPIELYRLGIAYAPTLIVLGGMHGDESEGAVFVEDFLAHVQSIRPMDLNVNLLVVPRFNPDGLSKNERVNGNGIDLNRNFPSLDWTSEVAASRYNPGAKPESESETSGLVKLLEKENPFLIVHVHTYLPQINYTGEISMKWAEILAENFGHPITDNIGYPTPGSLGQYAHQILKTACICVELPEQVERNKAWQMLGPALLKIAKSGGKLGEN